ncbi:arginine--tRNA ligase [Candidatus Aenigmatarchaeota archaeon]
MTFELFRKQVEKVVGGYAKLLKAPPKDIADLALPCFTIEDKPEGLSKQFIEEIRKNKKKFSLIGEVKSVGPFVNFHINYHEFSKIIMKDVIKLGSKYGSKRKGKNRILVEYSAPNSNKPLHIGHLRNDSIGMSISRILDFTGNTVVKANLVNDRGIHICKSMLAYQKWGEGTDPKKAGKKGDHLVGDFYVMFEQESKKDEKIKEESKEMLNKWEKGDKATIALWKKMNKWAIDGMKETYKNFGSEFDDWFFESEIYKKAKPIIEEGWKKGVFKKDTAGAVLAKLEKWGLPDKYIVRSDGTSTYLTQDMPLTVEKFEKHKVNESIWVVASEQIIYLKQLFKIMNLLGYDYKLTHLSYGLVHLRSGRMKSREGRVIDADDLMHDILGLARKAIKQRYKDLDKKETELRAREIMLAAIKYYYLKVEPVRDLMFEPEKAISFEGNTGPYLLYTYARARSILRKSEKKEKITSLQDEKEFMIIKKLSMFPLILKDAAKQLKPNYVANYLHELALLFNEYYHDEKIIGSDNEESKLAFVKATAIVLKNGLKMLGINTIEKM